MGLCSVNTQGSVLWTSTVTITLGFTPQSKPPRLAGWVQTRNPWDQLQPSHAFQLVPTEIYKNSHDKDQLPTCKNPDVLASLQNPRDWAPLVPVSCKVTCTGSQAGLPPHQHSDSPGHRALPLPDFAQRHSQESARSKLNPGDCFLEAQLYPKPENDIIPQRATHFNKELKDLYV